MDYLILIERGSEPYQDSEIFFGLHTEEWDHYESIMEKDQRETGIKTYTITRFLGSLGDYYYNHFMTDFIQTYHF